MIMMSRVSTYGASATLIRTVSHCHVRATPGGANPLFYLNFKLRFDLKNRCGGPCRDRFTAAVAVVG